MHMNNIKKIKVSIIVSTYNWPEALELTIKSIWKQSVLPNEIVIADDGSGQQTKVLVERLAKYSPVPMLHIWHEDNGFRLSAIRNRAIAAAKGDYILQVDGDVVLTPNFVSDHLELAERGFFVCGSRIKLNKDISEKLLTNKIKNFHLLNLPLSYALNGLRSRLLRHYMALRYAKKIDHLRGCNMAFWKDEFIRVNGYNEDLLQWGHEDGELAFRMHFAGIRKKALKMGGAVYHIYHKEASKNNEMFHIKELEKVKEGKLKWCENGINKYIM